MQMQKLDDSSLESDKSKHPKTPIPQLPALTVATIIAFITSRNLTLPTLPKAIVAGVVAAATLWVFMRIVNRNQ